MKYAKEYEEYCADFETNISEAKLAETLMEAHPEYFDDSGQKPDGFIQTGVIVPKEIQEIIEGTNLLVWKAIFCDSSGNTIPGDKELYLLLPETYQASAQWFSPYLNEDTWGTDPDKLLAVKNLAREYNKTKPEPYPEIYLMPEEWFDKFMDIIRGQYEFNFTGYSLSCWVSTNSAN